MHTYESHEALQVERSTVAVYKLSGEFSAENDCVPVWLKKVSDCSSSGMVPVKHCEESAGLQIVLAVTSVRTVSSNHATSSVALCCETSASVVMISFQLRYPEGRFLSPLASHIAPAAAADHWVPHTSLSRTHLFAYSLHPFLHSSSEVVTQSCFVVHLSALGHLYCPSSRSSSWQVFDRIRQNSPSYVQQHFSKVPHESSSQIRSVVQSQSFKTLP
mmetsp:Transcript_35597/g.84504  ORF Transcript_35597/g.84504 Transcript_35597/m.84504 type:complete len:217 (+) Transcript_35597:646-1296(+)